MKTKRVIAALLFGAFLVGGFAAFAGPEDGKTGDPKAKALVDAKCSTCHALARILVKNKDRSGWTETVTRMQQVNKCPITVAEAKVIIDYLVVVRGPVAK